MRKFRPIKAVLKFFKNTTIIRSCVVMILYGFLRLLFATYRLKVSCDADAKRVLDTNGSGIFYFWHQHILSGMFFFFKRKQRGHCVVSPSNDGKMIAAVCERLGFSVLFGSATKNTLGLVRQSLSVLHNKGKLCLVGDGSRGPAFELQKGIIYLAQKSEVPLFFVDCSVKHAITFTKSWDKFKVPLPFSTIHISVVTQKSDYARTNIPS